MVKVAFCLHGISKGKNFKKGGLEVNFESELIKYQNNFINVNNSDVFIHSWEHDDISSIIEGYKPVKYIFESPKVFKNDSLSFKLKAAIKNRSFRNSESNRINNIYSRWYSFYQVIKLLSDYEKENNVTYDYVFITRFDLSLFDKFEVSRLDKNKMYIANWFGFRDSCGKSINEESIYNHPDKPFKFERGFPTDDEGVLDFWFMSSSEIMKEFSNIYNELESLIGEVGLSNHKIALEKIIRMDMLTNTTKVLDSYSDFCLTRWTEDAGK